MKVYVSPLCHLGFRFRRISPYPQFNTRVDVYNSKVICNNWELGFALYSQVGRLVPDPIRLRVVAPLLSLKAS